ELAGLNRDYEVNRKKIEDMLTRRESAKMSQQIEQTSQDVRFKIIDPPRVPSQPSGPNRPLLMSMVLGAGLAVGVALAFLISQLWPTFDTRRSLMQITNVPVFGSVSAVLSLAQARRERLLVVAYASLGGMLLMAYAGLLIVETIGLQWPF
ncbi:MAG: chain-length determining protein, partial [Candidatus Contendobacter sp.]|nr:chain-length determining protein [Candidatus Contendobacter sp.]